MSDQLSPDGMWRWDGTNWVPNQGGNAPAGSPAQPQFAQPVGTVQPKKSGGCLKIGLIVVAVLFVVGLIGAALGGGEDESAIQQPTVAATPEATDESAGEDSSVGPVASPTPTGEAETPATPTEEPVADEVSFPGNGMYEVGADIKPGLYRSEGSGYWERLKDAEGSLDSIIANGNATGPAYVQIKKSDAYFATNGMGDWVLVDPDARGAEATEFGEGIYMVGVDIKPGTYKASGSGYWARLRNADGGLDAIIANGNPQGNAIVKIKATDKFFESNGMDGNWVRRG